MINDGKNDRREEKVFEFDLAKLGFILYTIHELEKINIRVEELWNVYLIY